MNAIIKPETEMTAVSTPQDILQAVLTALCNREVSEAIDQFDDHFTFNDHALGLNFSDKRRLGEFFQKEREIFPDTVVEVTSTFQCEDHVIAQWKLTATQTLAYGSVQRTWPISLPGVTVARIENGKITQWSDYYDEKTSRRVSLAAFFADWIE